MTEKAFHLKHINKLIQNYGSSAVFSQMADIPAKILRDTAAGLAEIDPIWVRQIENRMGYADGRLNLEDTLPPMHSEAARQKPKYVRCGYPSWRSEQQIIQQVTLPPYFEFLWFNDQADNSTPITDVSTPAKKLSAITPERLAEIMANDATVTPSWLSVVTAPIAPSTSDSGTA